ncbi:hypothetical protein AB0451_25795 [Streptomyces sp. NPDC052000]|uniref:hypothetical protein n=1 Tax=Streptomyces sp. NPDC052000 TaxID=3155676 RepID=UPI00344D3044
MLKKTAAPLLVLALSAAGCGSKSIAVPTEFCSVPVKKENLAPLLPDGENLNNRKADLHAHPGVSCSISIDGNNILFGSVELYKNRKPDPVIPGSSSVNYKHAAVRKVPFRGEAFLGSNGGVINVTCDDANSYLSVVVQLAGSRVDDTTDGYKKLQPFVEDFVPNETQKYGCTK